MLTWGKTLRYFIFLFIFAAPLALGFSEQDSAEISENYHLGAEVWKVDGAVQFHSLTDEGKSLIGAALARRLSTTDDLGARAMLSMGYAGCYALQAFWQHFVNDNVSRFYWEPSVSWNIVSQGSIGLASAGLAFGVSHNISKDIIIGGSAGFEIFGRDLPLATYGKVGSLRVSPKVLLAMSFYL